jgi:hypothetical protein
VNLQKKAYTAVLGYLTPLIQPAVLSPLQLNEGTRLSKGASFDVCAELDERRVQEVMDIGGEGGVGLEVE